MKKFEVNFIAYEDGVSRGHNTPSVVNARGPKHAVRKLNEQLWGDGVDLLDGELYTVAPLDSSQLRVYQIRDGKPKRVA